LIPGIGESLAREIVTYRERRKGFRSVEELKNVRGIGEKKYKDLKVYFIIK
jgi:competence protein ComEA